MWATFAGRVVCTLTGALLPYPPDMMRCSHPLLAHACDLAQLPLLGVVGVALALLYCVSEMLAKLLFR